VPTTAVQDAVVIAVEMRDQVLWWRLELAGGGTKTWLVRGVIGAKVHGAKSKNSSFFVLDKVHFVFKYIFIPHTSLRFYRYFLMLQSFSMG
jgi:hypothetical protein